MTHSFALESWAGQAAVDGYCKFWVKDKFFRATWLKEGLVKGAGKGLTD
jgi:hypothetical protein